VHKHRNATSQSLTLRSQSSTYLSLTDVGAASQVNSLRRRPEIPDMLGWTYRTGPKKVLELRPCLM